MFCQHAAASLLKAWMIRYSVSPHGAALVLGVSRRTVYHWLQIGRAPVRVAHAIDQMHVGPWIQCSTTRGPWYSLRNNSVRAFFALSARSG